MDNGIIFTYNALQKIRNRIPLYLGTNTMEAIFVFVVGMECVFTDCWAKADEKIDTFHIRFQHWVIQKLPKQSLALNWASLILLQTNNNDIEAIELFYQLLDSFADKIKEEQIQ